MFDWRLPKEDAFCVYTKKPATHQIINIEPHNTQQTAPGARFVVAGGDAVEKRPGKPDQPMLKTGDFMELPVEERVLENTGTSAIEIVEAELK